MKPVRVILSEDASEVYKYLNSRASDSKVERSILKSVKSKLELIKVNTHYGEPIPKQLIPNEYKVKYGITNLFHVELSNFWRMLYTLTNDEEEVEIIAFVLDITDHETYNKKFGYKRH
ncbi:MAG: hypothetical protein ABR981_01525 [Candidatus Micrarchaeaceae archaeon]|jgi:hypothetical protein